MITVNLFSELAKTVERQARELEELRPLALEAATLLLELVNNPHNRPTALAKKLREIVERNM